MNISSLTNHVCFEHIFKNCQNEDGTYDWLKISKLKDLPTGFIDKYFFQIYSYRQLERSGKLSSYIIKKYGNYLNWNILFMNQDVDEELISEFSSKINWKICAMTQKLSLDFLKKNYENILVKDLRKNINITVEQIQDYQNYLDSVE